MKVQVGQKIAPFSVKALTGIRSRFPDEGQRFTHLQFRRFAGCPICNFHLHTFFRNKAAVDGAGIREVIFFHSSEAEMKKYQASFSYAVVADPGKKFYTKFGVGRSIWATVHWRAQWAAVKGMFLGKMGVKMENGPLGLPADFLIAQDGTVVAAKYGTHAYDQWEVPELLALANATG